MKKNSNKKIYIFAYLRDNLGDDLIVKTLCDRYRQCDFYATARSNTKCDIAKNIKINGRGIIAKIIRFTERKIKKDSIVQLHTAKKCEDIIVIGGSIFMEQKNGSDCVPDNFYRNITNNKNYYIIGANIGPVYTNDFTQKVRNIVKRSSGICVRDNVSYKYIKDLKNTAVAPDVVLASDIQTQTHKQVRKVCFSVIDCSENNRRIPKTDYQNAILKMIDFYKKQNYGIKFISFCKKENDEKAIEEILTKCHDVNAEIYKYKGNMQEAIAFMDDSDLIIGSRFHANIIGLMLDKQILPICYNGKTTAFLRSNGYEGLIVNQENINSFQPPLINEANKAKIDLQKLRKQANEQFQFTDKILK